MFSIADQMAYLGKMVQGRQAQTADSASTPIPTGWIDVPRGQGESDHFLDRDWQQVRSLLQRLDWTTSPSLAVISPFKRVTRRLTPLIYEQVRSLMPENQRSDDDLKRALGSAKAERFTPSKAASMTRSSWSWVVEHQVHGSGRPALQIC